MPEDPSPNHSDGQKPKRLTLRLSERAKAEPPPTKSDTAEKPSGPQAPALKPPASANIEPRTAAQHEEKQPRKGPPPIDARVIPAPSEKKAHAASNDTAPLPSAGLVAAGSPETPAPPPDADAAEDERDDDIPPDAVSNAIKAGRQQSPNKRVVKLLTIAAGLTASALAVWWSTETLPFFMSEPGHAPEPASAEMLIDSAAETANDRERTSSLGEAGDPALTGFAERDPGVSAYVETLRIQHVQSDAAATRVVIGGVAFVPGSLVHEGHGLRLAGIDSDSRTIFFEDASGARYSVSY